MSMFLRRASSTAVVAFELPWWDSKGSGLYMYTCKFPDARCRPWLLLSDCLFHDVEKGRGPDGKHKLCTYGAEGSGRISVGWHTWITHLLGFIFVLAVPGRNRNAQRSLHQQLDRWYCHGHIHVVRSRPRWPHTWRYTPSPCHALPRIHVVAVQMVNV